MRRTRKTSFAAGLLFANSSPHLATLITGRRHLTPLAGRSSGPVVNGIWAGLNLLAGVALLQPSRRRKTPAWDEDLHAFELGCLTFAGWMALSERYLGRINSSQ